MSNGVTVSRLTLPQKLKLMEDLWADLSMGPDDVPVPEWHTEVLAKREELVRQGKAKFSDWADAKQRLRQRRGR